MKENIHRQLMVALINTTNLSKWVAMIVETFIVYFVLFGNLTFGTNLALSFNKCSLLEQVKKDLHTKSWVDGIVLCGSKAMH